MNRTRLFKMFDVNNDENDHFKCLNVESAKTKGRDTSVIHTGKEKK